jgi:hypothetical protein
VPENYQLPTLENILEIDAFASFGDFSSYTLPTLENILDDVDMTGYGAGMGASGNVAPVHYSSFVGIGSDVKGGIMEMELDQPVKGNRVKKSSYTASREMEVDPLVDIKQGMEIPLLGPKPRRGGGRAEKNKAHADSPYSSYMIKRNQIKAKSSGVDSAGMRPKVGKMRTAGVNGKIVVGSGDKVVKARKAKALPRANSVASLDYGLGATYETRTELLDAKNDARFNSLFACDQEEEAAHVDVFQGYVDEGPSTPPPREEDIRGHGKAGEADWDMLSRCHPSVVRSVFILPF